MQARTHPLSRAALVDKSSAFLGQAWEKGWLPDPDLNAAGLWKKASKPFGELADMFEIAGRQPEDVADFRLRLHELTKSIQAEADLNPLGRAMAYGQLVRVIRNRLKFGALWTRKPDVLATQLAPPIIVIGHMRSGTTRIHKLLAADPAHSHTRYCDAYHPVPTRLGLNRVKSALDLAMLGALNPWLQSIHPMAPAEVEEELAWIAASLNHSIYESQWHIPSFTAFSEARDPAPIYRELVRILRTDATKRGNASRPRVLKVPAFSEELATLLIQFPDARLIVAEREQGSVLRSAVSLAANQMAVQSDSCDLEQIEKFWRRKIALREERMAAALSNWNGPVAHLTFNALNDDWEREISRAYEELGLTLSDTALAAMRQTMLQSENGQHHAHSEQLEGFAAQL